MTASNTTPALESDSHGAPVIAPSDGRLEARLLNALRAIREVADSVLRPHEDATPMVGQPFDFAVSLVSTPSQDELPSAVEISSPECSDAVSGVATVAIPTPPLVTDSDLELGDQVQAWLVAELVKRTGYPEEMLELDLDLEAELGIDTVKQVASLAAVRERCGLPADPKFRMQDARTLRQSIDYLVARIAGATIQSSASEPSAKVDVSQSSRAQCALDAEPIQASVSETSHGAPLHAPEQNRRIADVTSVSEKTRRRLVAELVSRTGYPEDMLELDLDLEAELGIDTVKQVAALAAVREELGLSPDPKFRMQDARTLRQAIDYLVKRVVASTQPVRDSSDAQSVLPAPSREAQSVLPRESKSVVPAPSREAQSVQFPIETTRTSSAGSSTTSRSEPAHQPTLAELSSAVDELTEYVKSLALLMNQNPRTRETLSEPAAGAVSERAASFPSRPPRSVYPEVLLESLLPQAGCPWKGELLEVTGLAVTEPDSILVPDVPLSADGLSIQAHDSQGRIVAKSRRVRASTPTSSAPPAMIDAVKDGRAAANGSLLREYLDKSGRTNSSIIEWAHSQGFTLTVGGARVPNSSSGPNQAMLSLLGSAYDVTSFAWFGLTGTLHGLSAIERLCFHRIPGPGDEMLVFARMAHPKGGFWRADVAVFDPSGELFAELFGLEGAPMPMSDARLERETSDPADRAWRRFARRLGREAANPEDIAS